MELFPPSFFQDLIPCLTRKPYPLMGLKLLSARPNQEHGCLGAGLLGWKRLASAEGL